MLKPLSYYSRQVKEGWLRFTIEVKVNGESGKVTDGVKVKVVEDREQQEQGLSRVKYRVIAGGPYGGWYNGTLWLAHYRARGIAENLAELVRDLGEGA